MGIRWVEATVRGMADKDTYGSICPQRPGGHRRWTRGLEEGGNTPCEKGVSNLRGLPVSVSSWPATGTLGNPRACTPTGTHAHVW